jgi:hypothetical protein
LTNPVRSCFLRDGVRIVLEGFGDRAGSKAAQRGGASPRFPYPPLAVAMTR